MTTPDPDAITFRAAVPADALCLGVLSTQVFLDTYATHGVHPALAREALAQHGVAVYDALLAEPDETILVAERAGHLVGFAQVKDGVGGALVPAPAAAELRRLYVQERFTGRGVGRDLLRQAEKAAAARGADTLWLKAWEGNTRALHFYPRCGYDDVGGTVYTIEGEDFPNRVFAKRVRHVASA
jgi:GNAT superfamily N-acetyltransferase